MPELPDLQVFSKNLTKVFGGKELKKVAVPISKKLNVSVSRLKKSLEGEKLIAINRVGKELHFQFKNGNVLALHLMLHGKMYKFENENTQKNTIVEFLFSDYSGLALTDFQKAATPTLNPESKDAPDALSEDVNLLFLKNKLSRSKASIKNVLLDQHIIRGIGNAYADEILWDAGISPFSIAKKIPESEIKGLLKSIKSVLKKAEKSITKTHPDIISGEIRDFMLIHNPKRNTVQQAHRSR
ncbi:DNA-formamidopyrimidine glycosylase family protein [Chryseolinea sp. H1M3-3]|uniref:DNA-formamidopyrimidine glycosylase family protein n=1 Tax=Chryseolinea sp. H1M3-3 TaxID=3034144 RepID=UPI0023EB9A23|nr:DNA-formamidopyrimidine glycosylase family protein [Chryseolinea sp. H1M3-3]